MCVSETRSKLVKQWKRIFKGENCLSSVKLTRPEAPLQSGVPEDLAEVVLLQENDLERARNVRSFIIPCNDPFHVVYFCFSW